MLLGKPGRKPDTLIDQFFKAGGIFEDALGKHHGRGENILIF